MNAVAGANQGGRNRDWHAFHRKLHNLARVARSETVTGTRPITPGETGSFAYSAPSRIRSVPVPVSRLAIHWYSLTPEKVRHLSDVKVHRGTNTGLLPDSYILRISLDGKKAWVCQDSSGAAGVFCDVPIVDLTKNPPIINSVIKQVADSVESFAFHPNGKMAVVTCHSTPNTNCSIAVLDMQPNPPQLLYYLDTGGIAQGIEFTPDGDKLFVGSPVSNRIDVFDVVGNFDLRKNQKFLKTGNGHCSLTLGSTWSK